MITLKKVSKIYKDEYLYKNVSFTINNSDRIAIIGNNGVGKTTLFKCIINDSEITSGEVIKGKVTIGYLSQKVIEDENNTVKAEYSNIFPRLKNIENKMNELFSQIESSEDALLEYGKLETEFLHLGGYEQKNMIDVMLSKFGFSKEDINKKIIEFSGGQKTKLALIKLLLLTPEYLFLDEPTNHLDIEAISWLENYLKDYNGAVIIISHDRYFLNKIANKIVEIENKEVQIYNTKFKDYFQEKNLRYNLQLAKYEKQQKQIKEYEEFIQKFRAKPSKIGQVNDRKSKLERMEIINKPLKTFEKINFKIEGLNVKKAYYIDAIDADIGYDAENILINKLNLKILGGEKVGIIGENGIGKTTLLKTLLKEIPYLSGNIKLHHSINIGYFAQAQHSFNLEDNLFEIISKYMPERSVSYVRNYLARFLFKKEDVYKKVESLSGGERVRLTLAIFSLEKYDMIILDEPTNHLDFQTKKILEDAIKNYEGTVLCVSHDRYFLNEIVDKFIFIQKGKYDIFEGNYTQYENYLETERKDKKTKKLNNKKKDKTAERKIKKIEKEIANLEDKKNNILDMTQKKEVYEDFVKMNELQKEVEQIIAELESKYNEFETYL